MEEMYAAVIDVSSNEITAHGNPLINLMLMQDVLGLYENETTFILIGYSYGAMMTLKLAKTLEEMGKTGKVIIIDGSPELLKRLVTEIPVESENFDESIQKLLLHQAFKLILPTDASGRLAQVVIQKGWEAKLQKIDELYNDFKLYKKDYVLKSLSALFNRIKLLLEMDLKYFRPLDSTPLTLLKPTETSLATINADYGLGIYSPANEISIHVMNGNHVTIMENVDLPNAINNAF